MAPRQFPLSIHRILTNPVLCFQDWINAYFLRENPSGSRRAAARELAKWFKAGVAFPVAVIEDYRSRGYLPDDIDPGTLRPPRVVGLVMDTSRNVGLVNPLITKSGPHVSHSPHLPFSSHAVQSLLLDVCDILAPALPGAVPEILGFEFSGSLNEDCRGNSMDVAALLSALDSLTEHRCDVFASACAVVELGPAGSLTPVRSMTEKLDAFLREYGRGSLLIVSSNVCLESRFQTAFENIWRVATLAELAQEIGRVPIILQRLRAKDRVCASQMGLLLGRLRFLEEQRAHRKTVSLCERVVTNGWRDDVNMQEQLRLQKSHYDALRHLGRYRDSLSVVEQSEGILANLRSYFSWDEELGYAIDRAAALFDSCEFHRVVQALGSWKERCDDDPRQFTSEKRIQLFNTLGRALIMIERDGFEELFRASLVLQTQIDPSNVRRTESYLIHGFLRSNRLDEAELLLKQHEATATGDNFADGFMRHFRCELERRKGNAWPSSEDGFPKQWSGYTRAFALQAMGRQSGREKTQAVQLLDRAVQLLEPEYDDDRNILAMIARVIMLSRAAIAQDRNLWCAVGEWMLQRANSTGDAEQSWLGNCVASLGSEPDAMRAEKLVQRMPYL